MGRIKPCNISVYSSFGMCTAAKEIFLFIGGALLFLAKKDFAQSNFCCYNDLVIKWFYVRHERCLEEVLL